MGGKVLSVNQISYETGLTAWFLQRQDEMDNMASFHAVTIPGSYNNYDYSRVWIDLSVQIYNMSIANFGISPQLLMRKRLTGMGVHWTHPESLQFIHVTGCGHY